MAKKEIIITKAQAFILAEAIQGKVDDLSKIATQLMKKGLTDAAAPVYTEIKKLNQEVSDLQEAANQQE